MVTLKFTRICESELESRAKLVLSWVEKYALVSRRKRMVMVATAMVERMEPRRVPSRRSTGTLRYMSRLAMKGRLLMVVFVVRLQWCK